MNAKEILMKAVQCDQAGRILEAQNNYQEGIQILMELVNDENDVAKKKVFYERIKEYIDRAEQIKERVRRHVSQGELVSHNPIDEDATGYSYKSLFGKYITSDVKEVLLEEPYLTERYQFQNLIIFFELLVKHSTGLTFISLITKTDPKNPSNQQQILQQIKGDLAKRGVTLSIKFENSLHDRKIVLSNGYIIKIGRGLHFFKANNPLFSLGLGDYDFRRCLQTDVDIWRTGNI
ncbi:MIT domain-containing protein 1 [Lucilia cuprina]|uniref:MIT domain-containing protein 1 n=1 Tax=Lucilia cuprina TaxID=7375 RepID=UPI001F070FC6|nr:MIT domain-containing protein 1 [Lucilia cuprina]